MSAKPRFIVFPDIADMMRTGWFRQAHIKTVACYRMRLFLSQRRNLKRKFLDLENSIRDSLKAFGIRLNCTGRGAFEAAVRAAVANDRMTSMLMDAMLSARAALWKEYCRLHDLVVKFLLPAMNSAGVLWRSPVLEVR